MTSESDMLQYEKYYEQKGCKHICGVDEAGRGPFAGPVCAAAVILPEGMIIDGVNDSKKLSEKKREKLFDVIKEKAVAYSVAWASVEEIESMNILQATMLAMKRAVEGLSVEPDFVLADGNKTPDISQPCISVVKGDALSQSIAAASILAKVSRDRLMTELAKEYPEYQFEKHKGYGTQLHQELILKYGACDIHRMSFLKKLFDKNKKQKKPTAKKALGDLGEDIAAEKLRQEGYTIVERNFRCSSGEIDIIAKNRDVLLFVEVKTRSADTLDRPADAVDSRKEKKIIETAETYLQTHPSDLPTRMDIIEILFDKDRNEASSVYHMENAF